MHDVIVSFVQEYTDRVQGIDTSLSMHVAKSSTLSGLYRDTEC